MNLSINLMYEAGNLWSFFIEVIIFYLFYFLFPPPRCDSDKALRIGKMQ
jgi:hypothetical protein